MGSKVEDRKAMAAQEVLLKPCLKLVRNLDVEANST
jgi:hypothetical protein